MSGVAQVTPIGGGQKQYQVLLSPSKLKAYQISLTEVEAALSDASANTSAGFRTQGGQEYLIQGLGRFGTLDEIRETVVRVTGVIPVQIKDLGEVQVGQALKRGAGSVNGAAAVVIGIRKQPGVNTLDLTSTLDATLAGLASDLPTGIQVHSGLFRQADFIETAIANLEEALGYGGLLVVAVVVLFLANARASIITLFAIPFSLVAAFLGLKILGLSINGMTLGGLAIAIGELVDDAVIDVENVVRRWRQNAELPSDQRLSGLQVVFRASSEIRRSVVFATLIVMLLFLPLFALESVQACCASLGNRLRHCAVCISRRCFDGHACPLFISVDALEISDQASRSVSDSLSQSDLQTDLAMEPGLQRGGDGGRVHRAAGRACKLRVDGEGVPARIQ